MVFHGKSTDAHNEQNGGNLNKSIGKTRVIDEQKKNTASHNAGCRINFFSENQRNSVQ